MIVSLLLNSLKSRLFFKPWGNMSKTRALSKLFVFCFLFVMFLFMGICNCLAQELVILYTGSSHSSLYPCGHCPSSVGGGLSRRATVIAQERQKSPHLLLLDAGSLFAGGGLDEFSISPELDKQRTDITLDIMQRLQYDAIALTEDELRLGLDYLYEKLETLKIPFISCNVKIKGIKPYLIKDVGNLKVGITAVTSTKANLLGVESQDCQEALAGVLKEFRKKKVTTVVLLTSLTIGEVESLLGRFKQIDVVILNKSWGRRSWGKKINNTLVLYPIYQAKKLSRLILTIENKAVSNFDVAHLSLPLNVKEDETIKKILPACFHESDCAKKDNMVSICYEPGKNSECLYTDLENIFATIVTIKDCKACSTIIAERILKDRLRGITFKKIDYQEKQARDLIAQLGAKTLPLIVFDSNITKRKNFDQLRSLFIEKESFYVLDKNVAGIFHFLDRPFIEKKIDFFIDIYDAKIKPLLESIKILADQNQLDLKIHFVIDKKIGAYEESLRILSIEKLYPDKYWDYLFKRLDNIKSSLHWVKVLEELQIPAKEIVDFATSQGAKNLFEENISLAKVLEIKKTPVILLNNQRIFSITAGGGTNFLSEFIQDHIR